jgi:hypothetical protein
MTFPQGRTASVSHTSAAVIKAHQNRHNKYFSRTLKTIRNDFQGNLSYLLTRPRHRRLIPRLVPKLKPSDPRISPDHVERLHNTRRVPPPQRGTQMGARKLQSDFRPSRELKLLAHNRSAELRALTLKLRREVSEDAASYILQSQATALGAIARAHHLPAADRKAMVRALAQGLGP